MAKTNIEIICDTTKAVAQLRHLRREVWLTGKSWWLAWAAPLLLGAAVIFVLGVAVGLAFGR